MATPTLVQSIATGRSNSGSPPTNPSLKATLPQPCQAGNTLILSVECDPSYTIGTLTDDKGNTWVAGPSQATAEFSQIFYVLSAIAGTQAITVPFTGSIGPSGIGGMLCEWYNIVSAAGLTASASHVADATSWLTLSGAPTLGDLVIAFGFDSTTLDPSLTAITPGTNFALLNAIRECGKVAQYSVTTTSTNASFQTTPATDTFSAVAMVFHAGAHGSAPPAGIRINSTQGELGNAKASGATNVYQFPCFGNLLVLLLTSPDMIFSAVSDNLNGAWTLGPNQVQAGFGACQICYKENATSGPTLVVTATLNGIAAGDNFVHLYDCQGAATPTCHDVDGVGKQGNLTVVGNLTGDSITPTNSNGIAFNVTCVQWHTITGLVGAGYVIDPFKNSGDDNDPGYIGVGTPASHLDEDDGRAHVFNLNTNTLTFVYTNTSSAGDTTNPAIGHWESVSSAFKAAAGVVPGYRPLARPFSFKPGGGPTGQGRR